MDASHRTQGLLRLTMACNERCPFCNVPAEDHPGHPTPDEDLEAALQGFASRGERTATISGGEPTILRKRLVTLVARARALGLDFVELQTNAVLLTPDYVEELHEAGLTSAFVSLLADNEVDHDALAGLGGAFERCLAGIDALLDDRIPVTLNPVFTARTQGLPPRYIAFVSERFPGIAHISMSAVQPHGRAADGAMLPDYAVLGPAITEAREIASERGIELLNPYCGLPLCAGWADDLEHCVESLDPSTGPGLDNAGNKAFGPPCRRCALRPACGGAWHAYWTERGGSGLQAPVQKHPPWDGAPTTEAATVWGHDLQDDATDLALTWNPDDLPTLKRIRQFISGQAGRPGRQRVQVALGIRVAGLGEAAVLELVRMANAIGVTQVGLLGGHAELARKLESIGGLPVEARP